jgi:hypothetical protein
MHRVALQILRRKPILQEFRVQGDIVRPKKGWPWQNDDRWPGWQPVR